MPSSTLRSPTPPCAKRPEPPLASLRAPRRSVLHHRSACAAPPPLALSVRLRRARPLPAPPGIARRRAQRVAGLRRGPGRTRGGRGVLRAQRRQRRARDLARKRHEAPPPLSGPGRPARAPRGSIAAGAARGSVRRCSSMRCAACSTRAMRSPSAPSWSRPRMSARRPCMSTSASSRCPAAVLAHPHARASLRPLSNHASSRNQEPVAPVPLESGVQLPPPPRSGTSARGPRPVAFATSGTQGAGLQLTVRRKVPFLLEK